MSPRIRSLMGNGQRLDGGAMYGNAPKALWQRSSPADADNRIELACRSFLVEEGAERILLEAGIGLCFPPSLRQRYGVEGDRHRLLDALGRAGSGEEDITAVVLSHLHFDHAGGLLRPEDQGGGLHFPKARYFVGREAWRRAREPHLRDRASFLPELHRLLEESGRLRVVGGASDPDLPGWLGFFTTDGHTPGLLHAVVEGQGRRAIFAADLIPGRPWVHLPITMGYDRFPERLIEEKAELYSRMRAGTDLLLYTHDPGCAASTVTRGDDGRWGCGTVYDVLDSLGIDG